MTRSNSTPQRKRKPAESVRYGFLADNVAGILLQFHGEQLQKIKTRKGARDERS